MVELVADGTGALCDSYPGGLLQVSQQADVGRRVKGFEKSEALTVADIPGDMNSP